MISRISPAAHGPSGRFSSSVYGAVDVQADARADHDAHHGVGDGIAEANAHLDDGQFAGAPDHGGGAIFADGIDAENFGAAIAAAPAGRERSVNVFAPLAHQFGDVLTVGGEHLDGVAATGEAAVIEPPDLVGEAAEQGFFVRDEEDGFGGAAQGVKGHGGLFALQGIAGGEGLAEEDDGFGAGSLHRAGGRQFDAGGQAEEMLFAGAVDSDQTDDYSFGREGVEIAERAGGHSAKGEGHKGYSRMRCKPSLQHGKPAGSAA